MNLQKLGQKLLDEHTRMSNVVETAAIQFGCETAHVACCRLNKSITDGVPSVQEYDSALLLVRHYYRLWNLQ